MTKDPLAIRFAEDKKIIIDNLQAVQLILEECIDDGLLDPEAHFHNELLDLIDEAELSEAEEELAEVIAKAKTLETDIDVWLSMKGLSTLSLTWPKFIPRRSPP